MSSVSTRLSAGEVLSSSQSGSSLIACNAWCTSMLLKTVQFSRTGRFGTASWTLFSTCSPWCSLSQSILRHFRSDTTSDFEATLVTYGEQPSILVCLLRLQKIPTIYAQETWKSLVNMIYHLIKLNEGETLIITFYCSPSLHCIRMNPQTIKDIQLKLVVVHSNDFLHLTNVFQMGCAQIPVTWARTTRLEESCCNANIAYVQIYFSTTHLDVVLICIHWHVRPPLPR
jgi:hypothetical protein